MSSEVVIDLGPCVLSGIDLALSNQWFSKKHIYDYIMGAKPKWNFNDFRAQIARMYTAHKEPFPGKAGAYLDAQTALLDIADAEGFQVQTRLNSCPQHSGAIELIARFTHEDTRLDLRMVIDPASYAVDGGYDTYQGVYRMAGGLTKTDGGYRTENFRYGALSGGFVNMLKDELLGQNADTPPMNFCTIMDDL